MKSLPQRTAPTETVCVAVAVLDVSLATFDFELVAAEADPSKAGTSNMRLFTNIVYSKISRT